ncbi:MAG TPA: choice-of-anchor Q domain-containing protein [Candidatus Eisenbacteria bacterium]|nr:choice-of-anchor Q domain-containing protein [Candidatus Eisenbacteria bacterium]
MRARLVAPPLVALLLLAGPTRAAVFTVDTTVDAGDTSPGDGACLTAGGACALRAAIEEANALPGADTISLPAGIYVAANLDVTDELAIAGAGAATTIVDANHVGRVFFARATLALSGITVRNGFTPSFGGGVWSTTAGLELTLTDCVFTGNEARQGGAVLSTNVVTIVRSTFRSNVADEVGGGVALDLVHALSTVRDSTFTANTAGPLGGGAIAVGEGGPLTVTNTTIDGEVASFSSCIVTPPLFFECHAAPDLTLENVTVTSLALRTDQGTPGAAFVQNSIVLACGAIEQGTGIPIPGGWVTSLGYNAADPVTCTMAGDLTGNVTGNPMLGPLADNGGPTQTRLPASGSPVIDAGNPAAPGSGGNACAADDQRGVVRPVGSRCDIGAVEIGCGDGSLAGVPCADDGDVCTDDVCDATGACVHPPNTAPCADDGNVCTNDVCDGAGVCIHPPNTVPCDDGNPCTTGDVCSGGACGSGPPVVCDPCLVCLPAGGCGVPPTACAPAAPGGARLVLVHGATPAKNRLSLRWKSAAAVDPADFGDPTSTDDAIVCVYDAAGAVALRATAPAGGTCGTRSCWGRTSEGFRYRNRAGTPDGLQNLMLDGGATGRVVARGKGAFLGLGGLPLATPATARVYREGYGRCWGAAFSSHVSANTSTRFKAKSD